MSPSHTFPQSSSIPILDREYIYIYIYSFRLKLHQFLIHQSLLDSYLNFSVNSWYTWYIYLYTLSRFRSIIKVEYKRDRNDGAKHDAGKHGWWRDERPRTTAAKKSVFCRSSVVGHGEARWGATWNAGVIPRATDYLPERSEDKRYFVTKCSMRDRDGERERGRKRRGSFDKLWLASPPHWSGFLLAQSCNRGGEEENVRKVELTGENAWTRGKREEKKKKEKNGSVTKELWQTRGWRVE